MICAKCERPGFARKLCRKHYASAWRKGLPRIPASQCGIEGCERPRKRQGFCLFHFRRVQRGHPMNGPLRARAKHRYVIVTNRNHPLAMVNGRVAVHRMVLYDAVRGGRLPCFWCGSPLSWNVDRFAEDALYVDHLDHDRQHNEETNLVPACNSCNAGRMRPGQRQSIYSREFVWDDGTKVGT